MTAFDDLLQNPDAERIWLVEISAYNTLTAQVETLRYSRGDFRTEPTDSPANAEYDRRIESIFSYSVSLFSQGTIAGKTSPGFGALVLNNQDGGLDGLNDYAFDGRRVLVKLGGEYFAFSDFQPIFDGTAESIEFGDGTITIRLRDLEYKLDIPIQPTLYLGTGGAEGGAELTGKPKPLCFGTVYNFEPVLVDATRRIYQFHSRSSNAINAVRDMGGAITAGSSRANYATLESTSPTAGTFDWCITATGSFIRLGTTPSGILTMDASGDDTNGWAGSAATITQKIITDFAGFSISDVDTDSITALEAKNNASVGYYTKETVGINDVIDQLLNSIGAYRYFSRLGKVTVGRIEAPAVSPVETYTGAEIFSYSKIATRLPTWRTTVGYKPNYRVLTLNELLTSFKPGEVNAALAPDLMEKYRYSVSSSASVKTPYLLANDDVVNTLLASSSAADYEAARLQTIFGVRRDVYRVNVAAQPFARKLGETVALQIPRYGLTNGKNFLIIGMTEEPSSSSVELELWG